MHVPANKTSGAFTKPVDPLVGQVIEAWRLVRPPQPDIVDRKTGQARQHLFTYRGQLIGPSYLNEKIIPALCAKAGIPESDSRGALTSHRARATIATQLLNARGPLSLADLQAWLGHKHPASTRHYAAILQRTLTAAYRKADYFARNQRTIQVLIDRDTILSGAAAGGGQPWKYYDLGDGFCSYDFFAKRPPAWPAPAARSTCPRTPTAANSCRSRPASTDARATRPHRRRTRSPRRRPPSPHRPRRHPHRPGPHPDSSGPNPPSSPSPR